MSSLTLVEGSTGSAIADLPSAAAILVDPELKKLNEERAAIVEKYRKGREIGAVIDPWEDPSFEVYHKTDYYGFIHDNRLPAKPDSHEKRVIHLETERQLKWVKMFKNWEKYSHDKKLRSRTFKGIPKSVRGMAWSKFLDLERIKLEQSGKYQEMKSLALKYSPDIRQIDLDVNRTYRDHNIFRERYGIKQQALFYVLGAYSMYNTEIGYCQGMSQIAALFLMFFNDEEDAFWAMSVLMSNPLYTMHGFFIPGFPKLRRFQLHHEKIMDTKLPKLNNHLKKQKLDSNMYTLKWYFQCFLDRVPFSLALRLWDVFLLEGDRILIAQSFNILKLHRSILSRLDMEGMLEFLQIKLENNFLYDDDTVMMNLDKTLADLKKIGLDHPGPPPPEELPQKPFGLFIQPQEEEPRKAHNELLTPEEIEMRESLIRPQDLELVGERRGKPTGSSRISLGGVSKYSCDPSIDDVSSIVGPHGSQTSLAATSVTSAAELSSLTLNTNFSFTHLVMDSSDLIMTEELCSSAPPSVVPRRKMNGTDNSSITPNASGRSTPTPVSENYRPSKLYFENGDITYDGLVGHEDEPSTPKIHEAADALRIYVEYKSGQEERVIIPGAISEKEYPMEERDRPRSSPAASRTFLRQKTGSGRQQDRWSLGHTYDQFNSSRSSSGRGQDKSSPQASLTNRSRSSHTDDKSISSSTENRSSSSYEYDKASVDRVHYRSSSARGHDRLSSGYSYASSHSNTAQFNSSSYYSGHESRSSGSAVSDNTSSSPNSVLNDPNKITIKVSHSLSKVPRDTPMYSSDNHHRHFHHHQTRYIHKDDMKDIQHSVILSDNL